MYVDSGGVRYCQVDGLLFQHERKILTIIEAKIKHCIEAYVQLERLYLPVVRKRFPGWNVATCEVVKWFDPATDFPVSVTMRDAVHNVQPGEFAVHILNRV